MLAYVGKTPAGKYLPFVFKQSVNPSDIEFSDDMFVVTGEIAQAYLDLEKQGTTAAKPSEYGSTGETGATSTTSATATSGQPNTESTQPNTTSVKVAGIKWAGEVPPQKWMNFYTKVLSRFAATSGLKLTIQVEASPPDGLSKQSLEETKGALRELGLNDQLEEK